MTTNKNIRSAYIMRSSNPIDLHADTAKGLRARVQKGLEAGVDHNGHDEKGYSPLHHAVINKRWKIAGLLMDYGADVNLQDKVLKRTPYHYLLDRKNLDEIPPKLADQFESMRKGRLVKDINGMDVFDINSQYSNCPSAVKSMDPTFSKIATMLLKG